MQPNTRTQDTTAPQREDDDIDESSFRVLPESTFIEVLSTMRALPDLSQRLSTVNEYGQTLLHLAVHLRYRRLVQELVAHGIELDIQDMYGFTALHCAYLCEDDSVVTILKQGNASAGLLDTLGRLPTDLSANLIVTIPGAEIAEAKGIRLTSHTGASSARSCGSKHSEILERGYSTASEALSPPMSSNQKRPTGSSEHDPGDLPSLSGNTLVSQHECDPLGCTFCLARAPATIPKSEGNEDMATASDADVVLNVPGGERLEYPTFDDAPFVNQPILILAGGTETHPIQNKWIRCVRPPTHLQPSPVQTLTSPKIGQWPTNVTR